MPKPSNGSAGPGQPGINGQPSDSKNGGLGPATNPAEGDQALNHREGPPRSHDTVTDRAQEGENWGARAKKEFRG